MSKKTKSKIKNYFYSGAVLILTALLYLSIQNYIGVEQKKEYQFYLKNLEKLPIKKSDAVLPNLQSKSVYVYDVQSATVLFEKNADRLLLPASTTKLMTAIVALEIANKEDVIKFRKIENIESTPLGFFEGEELMVQDLIKASLINSSNEAAYNLAYLDPQGMDSFVARMNKKAQDLGLKDTFFENPAGFDGDGQKSSAKDLSILSKFALQNQTIKDIVAIKNTEITDVTKAHVHKLGNTHQLLGVLEGVKGVKTGTTEGANQVLITLYEKDGHEILLVVMGSEDRYEETKHLLNWVFDVYTWEKEKR